MWTAKARSGMRTRYATVCSEPRLFKKKNWEQHSADPEQVVQKSRLIGNTVGRIWQWEYVLAV